MKKIINFALLTGFLLPFTVFSQTFPRLVSVAGNSIVNLLSNGIQANQAYTATNLGNVPLTIYLASTATAEPGNGVTIIVKGGQTVKLDQVTLGGITSTKFLNIRNPTEITTQVVFNITLKGGLTITEIKFNYDVNGNRTKRYWSTGITNETGVQQLLPGGHRKMAQDSTLSISVFPNPTLDIVSVKIKDPETASDTKLDITIIDIMGRVLFQKQSTIESNKIDFSSYAQGVYKLNLQYGDVKKQYSIIKSN